MEFCNLCETKNDIFKINSCKHYICRTCFKKWCKNSSDYSHCPIKSCPGELFYFEIHKNLDETTCDEIEKKLKSSQDSQRPRAEWICTFCTFLNFPFLKFCDICQSNCPDNYQKPCYYMATDRENNLINLEKEHEEKERKLLQKEKKDREETLAKLKELTKKEVAMTQEISECPVCMVEYPAGEAIILHSCLHTICRDCFKNYLINTDNPKIKCPTENCIGQIEDKEIQKMLSSAEYENYQQLSLRTAEAQEKFSFHCKAPNCTAWIVHDEFLENFKCPICGKENCIKCNVIHEGYSCQDYLTLRSPQTQTDDSIYFENLIKKGDAMLCSGCKCFIEKVQGCDWIKCKLCQTELCWATKGPRWGPKGHGDTSGGCRCRINKLKCHPSCRYCH